MGAACRVAVACLAVMMGTLTAHAQRASSYPRTLYVTFNRAPVYDSANYMSAIIRYLRAGDSVQALGASGKFFRILLPERSGYVLAANMSAVRPSTRRTQGAHAARSETADTAPNAATAAGTKRPAKRVRTPEGTGRGARSDSSRSHASDMPSAVEPQPPVRAMPVQKERVGTAHDSSAAPAQRRCKATTKAGTQCSRMTSDSSGYCWQHRK